MNGNDLAKMRLVRDKDKEIVKLKNKLSRIKQSMKAHFEDIEEFEKQKFIGQWALFSWDGEKYKCHGVYDEHSEEIPDDIMEDTFLIMPLPDHETLNEFDGF